MLIIMYMYLQHTYDVSMCTIWIVNWIAFVCIKSFYLKQPKARVQLLEVKLDAYTNFLKIKIKIK